MDAHLDDAIDRWLDAEVIDDATAQAIRRFEHERAPGGHPATSSQPGPAQGGARGSTTSDDRLLPGGRAGVVAEGLAYLGAAVASGALLGLLGNVWDDLSGLARTLVAGVATLALGGPAAVLSGTSTEPLLRLRSLLAALAAGGVGLTVGVGLAELTSLGEEAVVVAGGVVALAAGVLVHLVRASWPTTLLMGAALLAVLLGGGELTGLTQSTLAAGGLVAAVGLAWAALGWAGIARPQHGFEVSGLLAGGAAIQVLVVEDAAVVGALVVGLVVSAGALTVGTSEQRTPPAVLGGLGFTVFAPQLVDELFGDALGGPLALFVGGVVLVGVAVMLLRRTGGT